METIAWIGVSVSIFSAVLVMNKKQGSSSDKILAAWLWLLAVEFTTLGIDYRLLGKPLLSAAFLLLNPAFYLYVASLVKPDFRLRSVQLLHLLPFLLIESYAYIANRHFSVEAYFSGESLSWYGAVFSLSTFVSWISYNSASIDLVITHRKKLFNELSNIEKSQSLGWLLFMVSFYNIYCLVTVITSLLAFAVKVDFIIPHAINYSFLLALVYALGFYGLRQQTILLKEHLPDAYRQKTLNLPAEKIEYIQKKLLDHFDNKKPYLNPTLSMQILSEELEIPKHQLTAVMNASLGKNFYQFVNEYRIEEVKTRLAREGELYSIEAIGYDCGFNSKSSFFTVFKQIAGMTPMQYREEILKNNL